MRGWQLSLFFVLEAFGAGVPPLQEAITVVLYRWPRVMWRWYSNCSSSAPMEDEGGGVGGAA